MDCEPAPLAVSGSAEAPARAAQAFVSGFEGEGILVALSGGPDSVALLSAVVEAGRGRRVEAAWVDHRLRPADELEAERAFVEAFCAGLGVTLSVAVAPGGSLADEARTAGGIEAAARRFRYRELERLRVERGCDVILTGHNADDVIETMLMRLCGGSGTAGLRGIPARSGHVRRPFLGVSRADILAYLGDRGLGYRVDSTNESGDYLRNRVRATLVPAARRVFPSLGAALTFSAAKAAMDDDALEAMARDLVEAAGIPVRRFLAAPLAVRVRALYLLAGSVAGAGRPGRERLPWRLVAAAAASEKTDGRLAAGAGVEFRVDGGRVLALSSAGIEVRATGFSFVARGPGEYRVAKGTSFELYYHDGPSGLRLDAFAWPLVVRSRRPGDVLSSAGGGKRLDRLLPELGVAAASRDGVPVVEDSAGIVAILGSLAGGRDAFRRNDGLGSVPPGGYLDIRLKGAGADDAVRR